MATLDKPAEKHTHTYISKEKKVLLHNQSGDTVAYDLWKAEVCQCGEKKGLSYERVML